MDVDGCLEELGGEFDRSREGLQGQEGRCGGPPATKDLTSDLNGPCLFIRCRSVQWRKPQFKKVRKPLSPS